MRQIYAVALLSATILTLNSCSDGYKKTPGGLEYKIVKDEKGATANVGDYVELNMVARYKEGKMDTVLFDSWEMNNHTPMQFAVPAPAFKGDISEGFVKLSAGDSAIIKVPVDSLSKQAGVRLPAFMKNGGKVWYYVKMIKVMNKEEMQKKQEAHTSEQNMKDDQTLQQYFTENKITPSKTTSGLYYVISKKGTGENAKPGQKVTVNYTGKTLDGKSFDSNVDAAFGHVQPFSFVLGRGEVIPGWDEGVALLNKGSKAMLYIPSGLAYGEHSPSAGIPADAILMFDIEVVKIEDAATPTIQ